MMIVNPDQSLATTEVTVSTTQNALEHLVAETSQYLPPKDLEKIQRAYELANQAHLGVMRKSGEPYILHPLAVAHLLADMSIDADGIVAALLHDVVEDTTYSLAELREQFGPAVANIVNGVTKFDTLIPNAPHDTHDTPGEQSNKIAIEQRHVAALDKETKERQAAETVRKMLLAMAEDPRVVVLKLADRLHNMRTLDAMSPAQQQNKARETREIYAPLAQRLGMVMVQAELEDLAFSYLEPEKFTRLAREVAEERRKRQPYVDEICRILQEEMDRAGIHAQVHAWQKHLASINRKLQQSGGDVSQIHDLISFRILVDTDHDCYLALGHIHALWRPKDGRIKDFIATPKLNGYQSLHTTVFCLENRLAEIQIRTPDMQRMADYGIASYWYLQSQSDSRPAYQKMIAWIEQLRDWQRELPQSANEFVEAVKGDIFQEQIFVFTPKGEVKDLPRGSTPLDMAYRIHTDIGDHCAGARIITNMADSGRLITRLVPLDYELQGGEIVDIVVNRTAHPTRDWLSFARTTAARTKIRRYLKTYEREINLQLGRERLDLALKAIGVPGTGAVQEDDITILRMAPSAEKSPFKKYHTLDDVYVAIGHEDIPVEIVVEHLLPHLQSRGDILPLPVPAKQDHAAATPDGTEQNKNGNTDHNMLPASLLAVIKLAHCCYPIPGDDIVGFLNPNKGMFVHRSDCRTLHRTREQAQERCVEVNWLQIEAQHYLAPIAITAHDRAGLLRDVAAVVADAGLNMTAVSSSTNASLQKAVISATVEIEAVDQLERLFKRLRQVKNVVSVNRSLGRRAGA